jgi:TonB family protein
MLAHVLSVLTLALSASGPAADSVRSDQEIRMAALRHVADVRRCYEREGLTRDPRLAGTIDVTITVLATGEVSSASVAADAMRGIGAREVGRCLTTTIRNWRFERGPYAEETIVFPFKFEPTTGRESVPRTVTG